MKEKKTKKEEKQIVEIHIYIHQMPAFAPQPQYTPQSPTNPPFYPTCTC